MSKAYLFYGNQLVEEFSPPEPGINRRIKSVYGQEIYDGGYLHYPAGYIKWYRCDLTPRQPEDVPAEIRALALLLT